ncbi:hypothetical protein [Streptomyces aurantiogriseus]|uniref:Uncharacterized protein n=1 Tax=Streptomyces aurantiogriseus TaxID=66870 RepID=A0A918CGR8_9ACTN|nr:hypothetical protein [Streptomyces aurantiogriseus]GGR23101.1 hypothetical protein GCM10010251_43950 [Streptomyces aurantiogriseus]
MTGTSVSRTGRVRVCVVDGEPALTEVLSGPRRKTDRARVRMIHGVRGPGYAVRPVEAGR